MTYKVLKRKKKKLSEKVTQTNYDERLHYDFMPSKHVGDQEHVRHTGKLNKTPSWYLLFFSCCSQGRCFCFSSEMKNNQQYSDIYSESQVQQHAGFYEVITGLTLVYERG